MGTSFFFCLSFNLRPRVDLVLLLDLRHVDLGFFVACLPRAEAEQLFLTDARAVKGVDFSSPLFSLSSAKKRKSRK
jgi:hypothetical protein